MSCDDNVGIFDVGDLAITAAGTQIGPWLLDSDGITPLLDGAAAIAAQLAFAYGSGGTSGVVYLQTSLDQGITAVDIWAMSFAMVGKTNVANFSGLTPVAPFVPTDGAMTPDTRQDGVLGDRFRLKIVSTGTYANTLLSGRLSVR